MTESLTTGQAIVKSLCRHGVDTVFGIPGAHTYEIYDALYQERDRIRHIVTRREQAAGYMAYGYAKSSGRTGVYCVVPGPGVLNSGAALCTGYGANTSMLCITAEIPAAMIGQGRGILHELPDQLAILKLLTKWSGRINHPTEAPVMVAEAFKQLNSGRTRPVALETPWDVLGMTAPVNLDVDTALPAPPEPDPEAVAAAVTLIKQSDNPAIMVGSGAVHARAEVTELAKLLQAPVAAHRSGKGIIGEDTPYGFSCAAAYKLWPGTDLLIGIGSRLELQYLRWRNVPPGLKVIRIDIDPTEMVRLKPQVGIVADAIAGTKALVEAAGRTIGKRNSREDEFNAVKARSREEIRKIQPQMSYLEVIRDVLPREGFFVEEISQVGFTSRFGMPVYEPRTYVTCGYQDNLGFGFMSGLGVKVANPDKAVVSVSGDGGFMYGIQELATAVQHNINLVSVVFNNQAYGNVLRDQKEKYNGHIYGAELINPNFIKLADSFDVTAYRSKSPAQFKNHLYQALSGDAPAVIEIPIERDSEISPWEFLMPGKK